MNDKANNIHVGSEDCTNPYTILGIECDLPHPLFFGGIYGEQGRDFTRAIRPEV
jgi:hypothetical protein